MTTNSWKSLRESSRLLIYLFNKYIYFEDPIFYFLSPIYVLMTYVYDIFDELGYLQIHGLQDSGKSRAGDMFQGLCHNPITISEISPAFLYRKIAREAETGGLTIIIDEADDLNHLKSSHPLARILRSGYRRNGNVGRCDINLEGTQFPTFCPKIIINQGGIDDPSLESRVIPIQMIKSQKHLDKFRFSNAEQEFQKVRALIYPIIKEFRNLVSERYACFQGVEGLSDRDEEVWTPILIIAEILDSFLARPRLFEKMLELANKIILSRKKNQLIGNRDAQILESTQEFINKKKPINNESINKKKPINNNDLYVAEEIKDFIKERWSIPSLNTESVSRTLKRHSVLKMPSPRKDIKDRSSDKRVQRICYILDRDKLSLLTKEFFKGGKEL